MLKRLALLGCLSFASLGLSGCNKDADNTDTAPPPQTTTKTQEPGTMTEQQADDKLTTIGWVLDAQSDNYTNGGHYRHQTWKKPGQSVYYSVETRDGMVVAFGPSSFNHTN